MILLVETIWMAVCHTQNVFSVSQEITMWIVWTHFIFGSWTFALFTIKIRYINTNMNRSRRQERLKLHFMPFLRSKTSFEKLNFEEKRKWCLRFHFQRKTLDFIWKFSFWWMLFLLLLINCLVNCCEKMRRLMRSRINIQIIEFICRKIGILWFRS